MGCQCLRDEKQRKNINTAETIIIIIIKNIV